MNIQKDYL